MRIRAFLAALLLSASPALAQTTVVGTGGMPLSGAGATSAAAQAILTAATSQSALRATFGAGAGNGVNVITDYGAVAGSDITTALQAAVTAACNSNPGSVFHTGEVYIPNDFYDVSGQIDVTNGCWIHGSSTLGNSGLNAGGLVLRGTGTMAGKDLFAFHGFGQFKLTDMQIDKSGQATQVGGASYARVSAAGTGYAVNDTITLTGGTFTTATVLKVTALSGSTVTGAVIVTPGSYSVAPTATSPVAQGSSSGAGTGATFNMIYDNAAAISISGPKSVLTADSASAATTITVATPGGCASVAACFPNGAQLEIERDDGLYQTTTVSGTPVGQVITLAAGLSFKASVNHPVYNTYGSDAVIENVTCAAGWWDCERRENSVKTRTTGSEYAGWQHDGIAAIGAAQPDDGASGNYDGAIIYSGAASANADVEIFGGGSAQYSARGLGDANYAVLFNAFFGPTGTWIISGASIENAQLCSIRVHQAVSGIEWANIIVTGNEFSIVANPGLATAQRLCVDAGSAPGWIRNITFANNVGNDYITGTFPVINVQDGDNVVLSGNAFNNNNQTGSTTGIGIGGNATHVVEAGNQMTGFGGGKYGTILASSLAPLQTAGTINTTNVTVSTSGSTGALVVTGGTGIGGALNVTGAIDSAAEYDSSLSNSYFVGGTSAGYSGRLYADSDQVILASGGTTFLRFDAPWGTERARFNNAGGFSLETPFVLDYATYTAGCTALGTTPSTGAVTCNNSVGSLSGTTASIGGSALVAGACTSGTVAVTGATTAMVAAASPVTYPGDGFDWSAYVSAAGTVTVKVCGFIAGTPGASNYNVRIIQ